MIGIVVSREDSASEHVAEHLLAEAEWTEHTDDDRPDAEGGAKYFRTDAFELRTFDDLHLHLDEPAAAFDDPALLVFVSRHAGETGPLLTAHFTGNFGPAEFGGEAGQLAEAAPNALAHLLAAFEEHAPAGYDVGMECTHHGPSAVGAPSLFAELGSGEDQWADPAGARAVARAVLDLRGVAPHRDRQVVGFGGGHYAPRFSRVVRETPWAVGHVASDWALSELDPGDPDDRAVVRQAFERSGATRALVDGDRPAVAAAVEALGYDLVTETWLRETAGVPLALAAALEAALSPVDEGLRFGAPARMETADGTAAHDGSVAADGPAADDGSAADDGTAGDPESAPPAPADGAFAVVDLPADLLAEAQTVAPDAVREAVAASALAFETREAGNLVAGRAALPSAGDREAVVAALVAALREKYDDVRREGDAVVATETAFDPAAARELGVPEGPKFGDLAAGRPVTVDGETVRPEAVRTERERRFPLS